jgi:hypothetical protein
MAQLLEGCDIKRRELSCDIYKDEKWASIKPEVHVAEFGTEALLTFLTSYRWRDNEVPLERHIEFLQGKTCNHGIQGWRLLAFQLEGDSCGRPYSVHGTDFKVKQRSRTISRRFGVYSEPDHIAIGQFLAGLEPQRKIENPGRELSELKEECLGSFLFYPVREKSDRPVAMGFALVFPDNGEARRLWFTARDRSNEDAVVVST